MIKRIFKDFIIIAILTLFFNIVFNFTILNSILIVFGIYINILIIRVIILWLKKPVKSQKKSSSTSNYKSSNPGTPNYEGDWIHFFMVGGPDHSHNCPPPRDYPPDDDFMS